MKLDWCDYEAAKYAVEHWHYSGRMPSTFTKLNKFGAWESGRFVGSLIYSTGSNKNIGAPYGLGFGGVCELVRVALAPHENPTSRIVAISLRLLAKSYPSLRLVVSYAATEEGHLGTLYQAGGWIYVGAVKGGDTFMVNGRVMLNRAVDASGISKAGLMRTKGHLRHKYLMPLDAAMRVRIAPLAKPYPKRAGSSASGTSPVQGGGGGANPTPALHSETAVEQ